jgi:hypothetical protein
MVMVQAFRMPIRETVTVFQESRNNDRLPWSTTFDLGVQHQITISGNNKLELRADIFNIFNAEI